MNNVQRLLEISIPVDYPRRETNKIKVTNKMRGRNRKKPAQKEDDDPQPGPVLKICKRGQYSLIMDGVIETCRRPARSAITTFRSCARHQLD